MSIAKRPEKIENQLDIVKISNEVDQLYLDMSQDSLDETIKEMYNLYNKERLHGKGHHYIHDALQKFLVEKKQNPDNFIKYCLDNQFNSMAQSILAFCYRFGKWVEKDENKAFIYYQKSAEMGNPQAIYNVGDCYYFGTGVEKDNHKAFIYYQKSAEMGDVVGISDVGYCYRNGIGVEKDEHQAFIYYQKSAEMGYTCGIYNAGYCYRHGIGVEKDEQKAFIYYQKSAEMGVTRALHNIGACYFNGNGVEKDKQKAFEYFLKSAEYRDCCGMHRVGWCYQKGIGVEKNKNLAFEWYLKSAVTRHNCSYNNYFRWIEYDNCTKIEEVGRGGISVVYKTSYKRSYSGYEEVAIKIIKDSHKNQTLFLNELKVYHEFDKYLGISMDNDTGDFILVLNYARFGSLRENLKDIFKLEWKIKLKILCDIINDLSNIHSKKFIHRNLNSGNILLQELYEAYIDIGSSISVNEKQDDHIYGVLPYLAPEVLKGEQFTQAADIYSFGIIMIEILTGRRPFDGYNFDAELAAMICHGLRPEFIIKTPKCYVKLTKQCINSDAKKRPTAVEIIDKLEKWKNIIAANDSNVKSKMKKRFKAVRVFDKFKEWKKSIVINDNNVKLDKQSIDSGDSDKEIKQQFLEADKLIKELPITSQKHDNMMYTSKLIDMREIISEVKSFKINE